MPIFRSGKSAIMFVHIPKTGGTSIERAFKDAEWDIELKDGRSGKGTRNYPRRSTPQHFHVSVLESFLMFERFEAVFAVVRDPLPRFVSEFVWSMRNAKEPDVSPEALEQWTFESLRKAVADPWALDNHLRPQTEFLHPLAHVYRYEDGLETAMRRLRDATSLEVPTELDHFLPSTAISPIKSSEIVVTPRVKEWVANFYAGDYRALGYQRPV